MIARWIVGRYFNECCCLTFRPFIHNIVQFFICVEGFSINMRTRCIESCLRFLYRTELSRLQPILRRYTFTCCSLFDLSLHPSSSTSTQIFTTFTKSGGPRKIIPADYIQLRKIIRNNSHASIDEIQEGMGKADPKGGIHLWLEIEIETFFSINNVFLDLLWRSNS